MAAQAAAASGASAMRSTSAEPTTTPSATAATARHRRRPDAEADRDRRAGRVADRGEPRGIDGGAAERGAGHAGQRDVVDERRRERARGARCAPASRSARRAGSTSTPCAASGSASSASSSIGRSTVSTASTPAAAARAANALGAHHEDRVVVAEQHDRRRRCRGARSSATASSAPAQAAAGGERALHRALDRRAVGGRIGERHAELDHVGAGAARGLDDRRSTSAGSGSPNVRYATSAGALLGGGAIVERGAQPAHDADLRARCATVTMSLSPRPDSADDDRAARADRAADLVERGDRVRGLERAQDALGAREPLERGERLVVGARDVGDAAGLLPVARARGRRPDSRGPALIECACAIWPSGRRTST